VSPGGAFLKSPDAIFHELGWRPLICRWVGVKVGRVRLFVVRSHGIDTPRNCIEKKTISNVTTPKLLRECRNATPAEKHERGGHNKKQNR
jgi:hypothetical protein